jgi:hypothetical protein
LGLLVPSSEDLALLGFSAEGGFIYSILVAAGSAVFLTVIGRKLSVLGAVPIA